MQFTRNFLISIRVIIRIIRFRRFQPFVLPDVSLIGRVAITAEPSENVTGGIFGDGFPISIQSSEACRHRICGFIRFYVEFVLGSVAVVQASGQRLMFVSFALTFPRNTFVAKLMVLTCSMISDLEVGVLDRSSTKRLPLTQWQPSM
jgi:hypothetical protein